MARLWAKSALILLSAAVPSAALATLTEGCHRGLVVSGDAGNDGQSDAPDAGPEIVVLHPDGKPLPGQSKCEVTITTNIPVSAAIHVPVCTHVDYATNPPSGGNHWPVWAAFSTYDEPIPREMYVHDEEHGAVILLHNCKGDCAEIPGALAEARKTVSGDPLCLMSPGGPSERVVTTPDPLLDVPIAAAAWGATYRATCIDLPSLTDFAKKHYGHGTETTCYQGTLVGADGGGAPECGDGGIDDGGSSGTGSGGAGGVGGASGSGGTGGTGGGSGGSGGADGG